MEMQPLSRHDVSQTSYDNSRRTLDGTLPPHQQPLVLHTGDPSKRPRAKTYCKERNYDFKLVGNYNNHLKDQHEKACFACRHPPYWIEHLRLQRSVFICSTLHTTYRSCVHTSIFVSQVGKKAIPVNHPPLPVFSNMSDKEPSVLSPSP